MQLCGSLMHLHSIWTTMELCEIGHVRLWLKYTILVSKIHSLLILAWDLLTARTKENIEYNQMNPLSLEILTSIYLHVTNCCLPSLCR